jgi:hypothetical protein
MSVLKALDRNRYRRLPRAAASSVIASAQPGVNPKPEVNAWFPLKIHNLTIDSLRFFANATDVRSDVGARTRVFHS